MKVPLCQNIALTYILIDVFVNVFRNKWFDSPAPAAPCGGGDIFFLDEISGIL
jgi:hypothetical protein